MQAEVDLPLATLGERLITRDTVVKGRTKAADLHPELVASWPGGASWPPGARSGGGPHPGAPDPPASPPPRSSWPA